MAERSDNLARSRRQVSAWLSRQSQIQRCTGSWIVSTDDSCAARFQTVVGGSCSVAGDILQGLRTRGQPPQILHLLTAVRGTFAPCRLRLRRVRLWRLIDRSETVGRPAKVDPERTLVAVQARACPPGSVPSLGRLVGAFTLIQSIDSWSWSCRAKAPGPPPTASRKTARCALVCINLLDPAGYILLVE
jgi:hypothetical protein